MRKYLPYADSPTIRSYTRWERFEEALGKAGEPIVEGLQPFPVDLPNPEGWFMEEHIKRTKSYKVVANKVRISSKNGTSFLHVEGDVNNTLFIVEDSERAPLSITGKLRGSGEIFHIVRGKGPHFSRWELEGNFTIRTYVEGDDIYLRYVGKGDILAYGVSSGERSDVHHMFEARGSKVINKHLLLGRSGSFLVHRPLVRVFKGGEAHLETFLVKEGGFVVGVPSIEVMTAEVRGATHSVKDLLPSEEQMFYLQSRGISPVEGKRFLIEQVKRYLLGDLYSKLA